MCVYVFNVIQESEKNDSTNIITMNIKFYQIHYRVACVILKHRPTHKKQQHTMNSL